MSDIKKRKQEVNNIMDKYPNRIPIIVESSHIKIDKHKYLVPRNLTIGEFHQILRKRIDIKPEEAIFLLINNKSPMINSTIEDIYDDDKDESGFLFVNIMKESTFGN